MAGWQDFAGLNRGYVLELHERFRKDPASVDPSTRSIFETWNPQDAPVDADQDGALPGRSPARDAGLTGSPQLYVGLVSLADSIRRYGHLASTLDPLGSPRRGDPSLELATHGLGEADLTALPASLVGGPAAEGAANALEAIERLRAIYCGNTGYDFAHIFVPAEREWLRNAVESGSFRPPADPVDEKALLDRLTVVEAFERFLHRTYPGKTRFSIEGLDMLVPVLDEVIGDIADAGTRSVFIGMAHRGRLNVLAHILNKPYAQILAEFKDPIRSSAHSGDRSWTGDVKYHMGASRALKGGEQIDMHVAMPPNPSHLEAIDPVLVGMARAAATDAGSPGAPRFDPQQALPILIHGDAAFAGQGVVAETLNLCRLAGYYTGGTIHIIANNQVGFTTDPEDLFSTLYSSGLARGFKIPIVHVNADDPEACLEAARIAVAYRAAFARDVLIDLVGYRRFGHNEGDEPAFTQPTLYKKITEQQTVRALFARTLESRGTIEAGEADRLLDARMRALQDTLDALDPERDLVEPHAELAPPGAAARVKTAVPLDRLKALNGALLAVPEGFQAHRKLEKTRERRRQMLDDPDARSIDWSSAEELAFASILEDGTPIRLTGEDVERGTFSQRHAVLHDPETGRTLVPLQSIPQAKASFEIHNSPLSENAAVGFEFGYNVQAPERLVLWEAQYGDFINGAQVVIDEFLVSSRSKWGQAPSLALLLPHAHEGQGPDHASARPERFLQLAADINMRVANCTTAAQYFHLLRRQAMLLLDDPLPLIVLTPKGLLRHPSVASSPRDLAEGRWQQVIDDGEARARAKQVRRLVLCSGKVAIDLLTSERRKEAPGVAICRVEQLYPQPVNDIRQVIEGYPSLEQVVWVQEEPENYGAFEFVRPLLQQIVSGRYNFSYIARPRSSSPAEGSAARHAQNQALLIAAAFKISERKTEKLTLETQS
ncbi:MAG: 2-oxoglutarate dehydrogenase E1 component [Acidobacteriota bacterium]|nr:2-oxoglutarate dehydrogenase E1 component [Acidobacteriota bacterium]